MISSQQRTSLPGTEEMKNIEIKINKKHKHKNTKKSVTAGKCNWCHSGWSARLVGFPQCYLTCRFLTNKIFYLIQVWVAFQNEKEEG